MPLALSAGFLWIIVGLAGLCSVLAAIAGTGGGSLMIPVFSLAFPEDVHMAVPLSKLAVFGVALGACTINILDRNESVKTNHLHCTTFHAGSRFLPQSEF